MIFRLDSTGLVGVWDLEDCRSYGKLVLCMRSRLRRHVSIDGERVAAEDIAIVILLDTSINLVDEPSTTFYAIPPSPPTDFPDLLLNCCVYHDRVERSGFVKIVKRSLKGRLKGHALRHLFLVGSQLSMLPI